ncbi:MAG TPA: hypothetical protein VKB69_12560 [Micromonosporaceae bacterium]|nr:hypothetical protein [Micromonosporaceae bacterium]
MKRVRRGFARWGVRVMLGGVVAGGFGLVAAAPAAAAPPGNRTASGGGSPWLPTLLSALVVAAAGAAVITVRLRRANRRAATAPGAGTAGVGPYERAARPPGVKPSPRHRVTYHVGAVAPDGGPTPGADPSADPSADPAAGRREALDVPEWMRPAGGADDAVEGVHVPAQGRPDTSGADEVPDEPTVSAAAEDMRVPVQPGPGGREDGERVHDPDFEDLAEFRLVEDGTPRDESDYPELAVFAELGEVPEATGWDELGDPWPASVPPDAAEPAGDAGRPAKRQPAGRPRRSGRPNAGPEPDTRPEAGAKPDANAEPDAGGAQGAAGAARSRATRTRRPGGTAASRSRGGGKPAG